MKSYNSFISESSQFGTGKSVRSKAEEMEVAKMSPIFKLTKYQGWTIEPTVHAAAQAYDRRPDLEFEDWKKMHRNVVLGFSGSKIPKADGDYIFYSKSMDQAYVAAVNSRRKQIRLVTVLPKGRSNPKPGTERLVVEGIGYNILEFVEVE